MKSIIIRFIVTMFISTGMQYCSELEGIFVTRVAQDSSSVSLESSRSNSFSGSRSNSIVSRLRFEIESLSLKSQVVEQTCAVAQEKIIERVQLKKQQARQRRYSFMEPDPK